MNNDMGNAPEFDPSLTDTDVPRAWLEHVATIFWRGLEVLAKVMDGRGESQPATSGAPRQSPRARTRHTVLHLSHKASYDLHPAALHCGNRRFAAIEVTLNVTASR